MTDIEVNRKKAFYACPQDIANGDKRGKAVVFVHGARGNHLIWKPQLQALSRYHTPIAIDLPGHGDSEGPGSTQISEYSGFIKGVVDSLGLESLVIVGHSMGGSIGLDYALRYPGVEALVLVGAGANWDIDMDFVELFRTDFDRAVREGLEMNFGKKTPWSIRELHEWNNRTTPVDSQVGDFVACNEFDVEAELGRLDIPACVLCGEEDPYARESRVLIDKMPQARAHWLPGIGHSPSIEHPLATNRIMLDFLGSLS